MSSKLPPPVLIEDQEAFESLLEVLAGESEIAVDTEADSFFSYREKVCLIQITAAGTDYLVDPLADLDLAGLGAILADPGKIKIFHDGEYDVLILGREYGFHFAGLFDTRLAASALGAEAPGLASVLEEHFGITLDKSMQRSNWGARPLSERQIDYARLDTHYLHELMHRQAKALEAAGRTMILEGECRRLEQLEPSPLEFVPDEWVRLKGARALPPLSRQACRELFILRNRLASEADEPPFRVLNNQVLVAVAAVLPTSASALSEVHGLSWRQVRRFGDRIMEALASAREQGPLEELPRLPPKDGTGGLDPFQVELHDRLKAWRRKQAEREGYDASLVLNRHTLVRLAREEPQDLAGLQATEGLLDWQVERFGEGLLACLETFRSDRDAGRIETGPRRSGQRRRGGRRGSGSGAARRRRR